MMSLDWMQCDCDRHWCELMTLDLARVRTRHNHGIYVIWRGGDARAVLRVGAGKIQPCIEAEHRNARILAYASSGTLYVTWAIADEADLPGIRRYLIETLQPLVVSSVGNVEPIAVYAPAPWMRSGRRISAASQAPLYSQP